MTRALRPIRTRVRRARAGLFHRRRQMLGRAYPSDGDLIRRAKRSRRVYLTFDDGPDPVWTPRIMDELERLDTRASFFVLAERVAEQLDLVREMASRGHLVELHGLGHELLTRTAPEKAEADLDEALEILARADVHPSRWRPPWGEVDWWTPDLAKSRGLRLTGASVDPRDWTGNDTDWMMGRMLPKLNSGWVVCMHDAVGPGAEREHCANTVALIEPLVDEIRRRRFQPGPLDGPAFWWMRTAPRPPADSLSWEFFSEDEIPADVHRELRELLASVFTWEAEAYLERGYRHLRPDKRVLVRADGELVAVGATVWLDADPPLRVAGLADAVVRPDWQLSGISSAVLRTTQDMLEGDGADVIIGDTVALYRPLLRLGYRPVPPFSIYHERDGACHTRNRYMWWRREPWPDLRLRLAEGDF